ncbi:CPBP family intramembrane glutamic endopeptidase [Candidatus Xianfuyuplasma coldseepsis]|uniref:CPBP family intramembrane metalloprotease n=1 Tax=Candidatus Xianfuyuplasma coldseepsis TaxID=2782163 RepID=A0A7L7KPN9_9MOLU|nr:CPBP family intramembrane glutamic endopeptidase [Xianfuyuplasma coldseepsis]QMS84673.1 CPBP family intramembrane metalloprotease [Xianfuyuplasma coldseepsis]
MNRMNRITILIAMIIVLMGVLQFTEIPFSSSVAKTVLIEDTIMRFLGGFVFVLVLISLGYKHLFQFAKTTRAQLLVLIPGLLVAINNFPIIATISGRTEITESTGYILLFLVSCVSIGFFEEVIFRGALLMVLLQRFEHSQKGILYAIIGSSMLFGVVHLVNLFAGASVGQTLLQVGYSFLMGMLFAVVFLKTHNLWYSVLLHTIYNIAGLFFMSVGTVVHQFDILTIIITTVLALIVILYYIRVYLSIDPQEMEDLYTPREFTNEA